MKHGCLCRRFVKRHVDPGFPSPCWPGRSVAAPVLLPLSLSLSMLVAVLRDATTRPPSGAAPYRAPLRGSQTRPFESTVHGRKAKPSPRPCAFQSSVARASSPALPTNPALPLDNTDASLQCITCRRIPPSVTRDDLRPHERQQSSSMPTVPRAAAAARRLRYRQRRQNSSTVPDIQQSAIGARFRVVPVILIARHFHCIAP